MLKAHLSYLLLDACDHDLHRGIMSRVFTPRRMAAIEPQVRDYAARTLDPLVGKGGFDFILDLGTEIPMRTIGMLLGIPEEDQQAIRHNIDEGLRLEEGVMPEVDLSQGGAVDSDYGAYIDWRIDHSPEVRWTRASFSQPCSNTLQASPPMRVM